MCLDEFVDEILLSNVFFCYVIWQSFVMYFCFDCFCLIVFGVQFEVLIEQFECYFEFVVLLCVGVVVIGVIQDEIVCKFFEVEVDMMVCQFCGVMVVDVMCCYGYEVVQVCGWFGGVLFSYGVVFVVYLQWLLFVDVVVVLVCMFVWFVVCVVYVLVVLVMCCLVGIGFLLVEYVCYLCDFDVVFVVCIDVVCMVELFVIEFVDGIVFVV